MSLLTSAVALHGDFFFFFLIALDGVHSRTDLTHLRGSLLNSRPPVHAC